jgi:tol-pal system protein YbgF
MLQLFASATCRSLPAAGLALGALLGFASVSPALAQTVEDRLGRLEREMQNVERRVFTNAAPTQLNSYRGEQVQLAQAGNFALQDRMDGLERQITNLTGQVEDLDIKIRQLNARIDKLTTDLEFRMSQLEGGQGGGPRPQTAGASPTPSQPQSLPPLAGRPPAGQSPQLPSTGPLVTQPQQQGPQGGVLRPPSGPYTPSVEAQPQSQQQAAAPVGGSVEQQYEAAQQMLRAGQYAQAEQTLREIVARNPRHQLAASAQYWLGETYYVRQDYQNASVAFADGYKNYPKGNKAPDTLLKLGMSLSALKKDQDACAVYDRLAKEYPTAPEIVRRRATEERRKSRCT